MFKSQKFLAPRRPPPSRHRRHPSHRRLPPLPLSVPLVSSPERDTASPPPPQAPALSHHQPTPPLTFHPPRHPSLPFATRSLILNMFKSQRFLAPRWDRPSRRRLPLLRRPSLPVSDPPEKRAAASPPPSRTPALSDHQETPPPPSRTPALSDHQETPPPPRHPPCPPRLTSHPISSSAPPPPNPRASAPSRKTVMPRDCPSLTRNLKPILIKNRGISILTIGACFCITVWLDVDFADDIGSRAI